MARVRGIELFEASAAAFRSVLAEVRPDQHHLATPCEPLDVSELVARAIGHQDWVRGRVTGGSDPPRYDAIEPDAWLDAFDGSTTSMLATLRAEGTFGPDRRARGRG